MERMLQSTSMGEKGMDQVEAGIKVIGEIVNRDMSVQEIKQVVRLMAELKRMILEGRRYAEDIEQKIFETVSEGMDIIFVSLNSSQEGQGDGDDGEEYGYGRGYGGGRGKSGGSKRVDMGWERKEIDEWREIMKQVMRVDVYNVNIKSVAVKIVKKINKAIKLRDEEEIQVVKQQLAQMMEKYEAEKVYDLSGQGQAEASKDLAGYQLSEYTVGLLQYLTVATKQGQIRNVKREQEEEVEKVVELAIRSLQISQEQKEEWDQDIDEFVADETDTGYKYTVRMAGQDLLLCVGESRRITGAEKIVIKVSQGLLALFNSNAGLQGRGLDWIIKEAILFALENMFSAGSLADKSQITEIYMSFVVPILTQAQPQNQTLGDNGSQYMRARAFSVMAAIILAYSESLAPEIKTEIVGMAIQTITNSVLNTQQQGEGEEGREMVVQVCALKLLSEYISLTKPTVNASAEEKGMIVAQSRQIIECGIVMAQKLSQDSVHMALEVIYYGLPHLLSPANASQENVETNRRVAYMLGYMLEKFHDDSLLSSLVIDIVGRLDFDATYSILTPLIVQFVTGGIQQPTQQPNQQPRDYEDSLMLVTSGLELAAAMTKAGVSTATSATSATTATTTTATAPQTRSLPSDYIAQMSEMVFGLISITTLPNGNSFGLALDPDFVLMFKSSSGVLQGIQDCLKQLIQRAPDQLLATVNNDNRSVCIILQFIESLLSPISSPSSSSNSSASGALFIGDLIFSLLYFGSDYLQQYQHNPNTNGLMYLTTLMLKTLETSSSSSGAASAVVVSGIISCISLLIIKHPVVLLDYLSSTPATPTSSALELFVTSLCEFYSDILGDFYTRVVANAIFILLNTIVNPNHAGDPKSTILQNLVVDDLQQPSNNIEDDDIIVTRSRAKAKANAKTNQPAAPASKIPLSIKLFKILLSQYSLYNLKNNNINLGTTINTTSDNGNDSDNGNGNDNDNGWQDYNSDFSDDVFYDEESDNDTNDELDSAFLSDPLNASPIPLQIASYIKSFPFDHLPTPNPFMSYFSPLEAKTASSCLSSL
ncbi:hypothetical protein AX774_g7306 [Zancudomyces culisetae]|uniref:Importin-9 central HEAT repeats domain-containing protein n=1 Tax=Zancudomyces culisetae TaxID=1213189 RepID=A0A1R1PE97_ZANCU|nr:hypothetical protein AX774_g7306 [Zancudomyces culisetae]|eukprot:OMH79286.1 hypothetical protein AX774_g7306 [Zancudomyces culisetae]